MATLMDEQTLERAAKLQQQVHRLERDNAALERDNVSLRRQLAKLVPRVASADAHAPGPNAAVFAQPYPPKPDGDPR